MRMPSTVYVDHPDGSRVRLGKGTECPEWALDVITNPKVLAHLVPDDADGKVAPVGASADTGPQDDVAPAPGVGKVGDIVDWIGTDKTRAADYILDTRPGVAKLVESLIG